VLIINKVILFGLLVVCLGLQENQQGIKVETLRKLGCTGEIFAERKLFLLHICGIFFSKFVGCEVKFKKKKRGSIRPQSYNNSASCTGRTSYAVYCRREIRSIT
jgi:hypothetical protein